MSALLGTVNGMLPSNLALNPTSVAGGSDTSGECSILSGLLTQLDAAGGTSPVTGLVTGILNQVLGLTGGNAVSIEPLSIDLGGSTSSVSTSGNVVTDSVTQHAVDVNLFGLADLQVAPTTASVALDRSTGTVTPELQRRRRLLLDQRLAAEFRHGHAADQPGEPDPGADGRQQRARRRARQPLDRHHRLQPDGNLLTCDTSAPGTTATAKVGVVNLGLLTALRAASASTSVTSASPAASTATPAVATSPATTPGPPAAAGRRRCPTSPACTPASSGRAPCPSSCWRGWAWPG